MKLLNTILLQAVFYGASSVLTQVNGTVVLNLLIEACFTQGCRI